MHPLVAKQQHTEKNNIWSKQIWPMTSIERIYPSIHQNEICTCHTSYSLLFLFGFLLKWVQRFPVGKQPWHKVVAIIQEIVLTAQGKSLGNKFSICQDWWKITYSPCGKGSNRTLYRDNAWLLVLNYLDGLLGCLMF